MLRSPPRARRRSPPLGVPQRSVDGQQAKGDRNGGDADGPGGYSGRVLPVPESRFLRFGNFRRGDAGAGKDILQPAGLPASSGKLRAALPELGAADEKEDVASDSLLGKGARLILAEPPAENGPSSAVTPERRVPAHCRIPRDRGRGKSPFRWREISFSRARTRFGSCAVRLPRKALLSAGRLSRAWNRRR